MLFCCLQCLFLGLLVVWLLGLLVFFWLDGCMVVRLVAWFGGRFVGLFLRLFVGFLVGRLYGCLFGLLVSFLVGRLYGWLLDLMVGFLV